MAKLTVERGLSVRDVERYARLAPGAKKKGSGVPALDPFLSDLENRLRLALSAKVTVTKKGKGGSITVGYADAAQLDAILSKMGVS